MATRRTHGNRIELKAYAGIDPATGKKHYLYDSVPADTGKRELDRRAQALDRVAIELKQARHARRRDPAAPKAPPPRRPARARTIGDAVETWWKHHGSKLDGAPRTRMLIDSLILPHLGALKIALVAGTPPDDPDERDADLVYLSERWEEIRLTGRKVGDEPLKPSVIHRAHGIVGAALRRAGHPIPDPGLPAMGDTDETTPLPEEMAAFMPYLAGAGRSSASYTATRKVRGTDKTITYTVAARPVEPNAMDLMTEAFALLVASGPRPVEAAAITRAQVDMKTTTLALDGRGVVEDRDADGKEIWVIRGGETAKRRRRVITLDSRTASALKLWLDFQTRASLARGARLGPRALVFSFDAAALAPISPKVFSGAFARSVDRARAADVAVPDGFHLYDMRHFAITQMLRNGHGRNVAAVAKRFGTSTRMIEARYEHAIPRDDAGLADIMGTVWGDPPGFGEVVPLRP